MQGWFEITKLVFGVNAVPWLAVIPWFGFLCMFLVAWCSAVKEYYTRMRCILKHYGVRCHGNNGLKPLKWWFAREFKQMHWSVAIFEIHLRCMLAFVAGIINCFLFTLGFLAFGIPAIFLFVVKELKERQAKGVVRERRREKVQ
jgi:hypothetical protein